MKKTISAVTILASISITGLAQTSSFTDWTNSGWVGGDLSGSANWNTYGTVNAVFTGTPGATFKSATGTAFPRVGSSQGDLEIYGTDLTAAQALTWLAGGTANVDQTTGTFTFNDLANASASFPSDSVFYLTDNDVEPVLIEAFLSGNPVSVSNWFAGNVQTSSTGFGTGSGWDAANATTIPAGGNEEFFVQQFTPDTVFDTLVITNQNGSNGRIGFTIGNVVVPVPEPSSTALLGFGVIGFVLRRKR